MKKIHLVYYSPAMSTRKIIRFLGKSMGEVTREHDITMGIEEPLSFDSDDLVIFGVPVFAGRVPAHWQLRK